MADLWMPGAVRADVGGHAACDTQYPAKAIAHITWDKNATPAKPVDLVPFANLKAYFTSGGKGMAPHILWDPFSGQFAQFYPADSRSKSVVDLAGGTRTNRAGKVVIQVEALFFPYCRVDGKVYAQLDDTPCKGWQTLQDWVTSWGVPQTWPMGRPTDFSPHRSEHVWETEGGWYGHSETPENTHVDPGSWPQFVAASKPVTKPVYEPFPGSTFFKTGHRSSIIAAMHRRLVAVGCNHYASAANADVWGSGDERSYAAWQRKLGYTGAAADGIPGPSSWSKLHVPNA